MTTSIEATLIESSSPLFTILGGLFLLKENINRKEWMGILLAVIGTSLLVVEPLTREFHPGGISLTGNLLIILSNISWAIFLLGAKKSKTTDLVDLNFFSFLISIPFFFVLSRFDSSPLFSILNMSFVTNALPGIVFMAIGGSIIAFWAYQKGQKLIEASEAAVFTYLKPIIAIPLAIIWLKESVTPVTLVAAAITITGVYLSEKR